MEATECYFKEKVFRCRYKRKDNRLCPYSTTSIEEIKNHNNDVHKPTYICNECEESFKGWLPLKKHLLDEHNIKRKAPAPADGYQCSICKFYYKTRKEMRQHQKSTSCSESIRKQKEEIENKSSVDSKKDIGDVKQTRISLLY